MYPLDFMCFRWQSKPAISYKYDQLHHKPLVCIHTYTVYPESKEQHDRTVYVLASLAPPYPG